MAKPASPKLSEQASSTVATVWYEETTFAPASAVASARACTSPDLPADHTANDAENSSASTINIATADATVV